MSYLGIDPSLRAYKQALFRATGGETTLPIEIDVEALVIKNGSLLIPDNDYYISDSNRIVVSKPALPGDEYFVINLSTFSFDGMATKKDLQDAIAGTEQQPLFFVMWWPKRSTIPAGFVPADGQLELRATYKEAANQIDLGTMPFVTEADWLADKKLRASYTKGDGTTNFRMPDYNGKSQGGSAAVVLRGDGLNTDPVGSIQGDAIRNISGSFRTGVRNEDVNASDGAFSYLRDTGGSARVDGGELADTITFNASRVVPTGPENRMVNTAGCWCVRLAHKVVATGVLDANGVVQSVNNHSMQIAEIESKLADVTADISKTLEMNKWYIAGTPQFASRFEALNGWRLTGTDCMMKENEYEVLLKAIIRRDDTPTHKEIVKIKNPNGDKLLCTYTPFLSSVGITSGGYSSFYTEKIVVTGTDAFISCGQFASLRQWVMIDLIITKNPEGS